MVTNNRKMLCDAAACISLDMPIRARKMQLEAQAARLAKQLEDESKLQRTTEEVLKKKIKIRTLEIGDRVEVRDGDEEWEIGTVKSFDDFDEYDDVENICQVEGIRIRGIPRVKKDGFDTAYTWDEFRIPIEEEEEKKEEDAEEEEEKTSSGHCSDKGGDDDDEEEDHLKAKSAAVEVPKVDEENKTSFVDTEKKVRRMLEEQRLSPVRGLRCSSSSSSSSSSSQFSFCLYDSYP
jgi:hypothetical protein